MLPSRDFRTFIDPAHELVLFLDRGQTSLAQCLKSLHNAVHYHPAMGRTDFASILLTLREGRRPAINCLSWSCLLASLLLKKGIPARVLVGGRRGLTEYHAWTLVPWEDRFIWVDPMKADLVPTQGSWILRTHRVIALFDQHELYLEAAEIRRQLPSCEGPKFVSFGRWPAALMPLLQKSLRGTGPFWFRGEAAALEPSCLPILNHPSLVTGAARACLPGPALTCLSDAALHQCHQASQPYLGQYLQLLRSCQERIAAIYGRTSAAEIWPYSACSHVLHSGMLMDLRVGSVLQERGWVGDCLDEATIWAFETAPSAHPFGVQFFPGHLRETGFAQLWHRTVPRSPLSLAPTLVDEILSAPKGRIAEAKTALVLRYLKLAHRHGLSFPVFNQADMALLWPLLTEGALALVDQVLFPALQTLSSLPGLPGEASARQHALVRLLLEWAMEKAMACDLLPPIVPSADWGRWAWSDAPGRFLHAGLVAKGAAYA
jgi:hypothetical protein